MWRPFLRPNGDFHVFTVCEFTVFTCSRCANSWVFPVFTFSRGENSRFHIFTMFTFSCFRGFSWFSWSILPHIHHHEFWAMFRLCAGHIYALSRKREKKLSYHHIPRIVNIPSICFFVIHAVQSWLCLANAALWLMNFSSYSAEQLYWQSFTYLLGINRGNQTTNTHEHTQIYIYIYRHII